MSPVIFHIALRQEGGINKNYSDAMSHQDTGNLPPPPLSLEGIFVYRKLKIEMLHVFF